MAPCMGTRGAFKWDVSSSARSLAHSRARRVRRDVGLDVPVQMDKCETSWEWMLRRGRATPTKPSFLALTRVLLSCPTLPSLGVSREGLSRGESRSVVRCGAGEQ